MHPDAVPAAFEWLMQQAKPGNSKHWTTPIVMLNRRVRGLPTRALYLGAAYLLCAAGMDSKPAVCGKDESMSRICWSAQSG